MLERSAVAAVQVVRLQTRLTAARRAMLWVVGVAGFQARSAPSCRAVPRWSVVPSLYEEQEKALTNRGEFEEALLGAGGPVLEATCGPLADALAVPPP